MFGLITGIISVAVSIGKALAVAGLAITALRTLANAFVALGKALGLIKPETNAVDLGDKAIQAEEAGIKPENFTSYAEYAKKVEDYKTDPEKSKKIDERDKLNKGIEVTTTLAAEKYPDFPVEALAKYAISSKNPEYFTDGRMGEFGKLMASSLDMAKNAANYLTGSEKNSANRESALNTLVDIEKKANPSISDADALKNVMSARK